MNELMKKLFSADKLSQWVEIGISLIFILAIAFLVWIGISIAFNRLKKRTKSHQAQTMISLVHSIINYTLFFIISVFVLQALGINTSALIASAGVIGFAVSFGSQKIVQDLVAGLFIVFEDQFDVGETVEISGVKGEVMKIGLRTTTITGESGDIHIIPNGSIDHVTNFSRSKS